MKTREAAVRVQKYMKGQRDRKVGRTMRYEKQLVSLQEAHISLNSDRVNFD